MPDRNEEFIRLFAANQRRIYGFVAAMIPRTADVDDVFQEVSMSLWRKFEDFEPGTDFAAWAIQFARLLVLKHYEKQRQLGRFVFDDELLNLIADQTVTTTAKLDGRLEALRDCLEKLPKHSRQLLNLRYDAELKTCREVAGRVGRSVDATYKALSRIHDMLLRCIERTLVIGDTGECARLSGSEVESQVTSKKRTMKNTDRYEPYPGWLAARAAAPPHKPSAPRR